ncbi:MAG: hypothetical protein IJP66_05050 [Kiritimatiellae bacterium]|nr:hypothetical protein [Kiritimatiellia bacterium]
MRQSPRQTAFFNRDLATKIGGFGVCGRPCCCTTWMKNPNALKVSIRMAKSQNIALDPDSLNGFCQQMKCCVAFENGSPEATCEHVVAKKGAKPAPGTIRRFRTFKVTEDNYGNPRL